MEKIESMYGGQHFAQTLRLLGEIVKVNRR